MNNHNATGTLNFNRLIAEAEALLLGEQLTDGPDNRGDGRSPTCFDKKIKHTIRRPLATASAR
jgi:hypothetical protein